MLKIFRLNIAILEFNISTFFSKHRFPKNQFRRGIHYRRSLWLCGLYRFSDESLWTQLYRDYNFIVRNIFLNLLKYLLHDHTTVLIDSKNTIYKSLDCKILSHLSNSCSIGSLQNVDLLSPLQQRAAEVVGMYLQLYGKWVNLIGISLSCKHHRAQERTS